MKHVMSEGGCVESGEYHDPVQLSDVETAGILQVHFTRSICRYRGTCFFGAMEFCSEMIRGFLCGICWIRDLTRQDIFRGH